MISEIRKEAKSYAFRNDGYGYDLNTCEDIFSDGAEWMKELIIQKACEWLKKQKKHSHHNADKSATLYMQNYYDGMKEAYRNVISYIYNMEAIEGGKK